VATRIRAQVVVLAIALLASLLLGGCSDNGASGPLTFGGYQLMLDGQPHDPYFSVEVCSDGDDPAHVSITGVEGRVLKGAKPSSLDFAIAWPDGPPFEPTISARQPVPDAYVPAVGAEGTIDTCDNLHVSAWLAVVFPHVGKRPVWVHDVTVHYDVDGHHYVGEAGLLVAQCPLGQDATGAGPDGRLCRQAHQT
jgi:hypothetical protein